MTEKEFQEALRSRGQASHDLEMLELLRVQLPYALLAFALWIFLSEFV